MRLLVDTLIVCMIASILMGVAFYFQHHRDQAALETGTVTSLTTLREVLFYHAALEETVKSQAGYPLTIEPTWFKNQPLPQNHLLDGHRPWLDVAGPGNLLDQPSDPIAISYGQAQFWYNPNLGIVRARIAGQLTDQHTLALYNQINHTALARLPAVSIEPTQLAIVSQTDLQVDLQADTQTNILPNPLAKKTASDKLHAGHVGSKPIHHAAPARTATPRPTLLNQAKQRKTTSP